MAITIKANIDELNSLRDSLLVCRDSIDSAGELAISGSDIVGRQGLGFFLKTTIKHVNSGVLSSVDKGIGDINVSIAAFEMANSVINKSINEIGDVADWVANAGTGNSAMQQYYDKNQQLKDYVGQPQYADKCTYISTSMLVERYGMLQGNNVSTSWSDIKKSMGGTWIGRDISIAGNTYPLKTEKVDYISSQGNGDLVNGIKTILMDHPEGVVMYCRYGTNDYHAITVTGFTETDQGITFNAIDPVSVRNGVNGGKEIPLEQTWLYSKHTYGSYNDLFSSINKIMYVNQ